MHNLGGLFIGLGIGSMFIIIALIQNQSRKKSKTWDGIVIDKKVKEKKRKNNASGSDDYRLEIYDYYTFSIKSDEGKNTKLLLKM